MIVLLCGKAGSGKDTAAQILQSVYDVPAVAQSAPLKQFCAEAFSFDADQLHGPSEFRNALDMRFSSSGAWDHAENVVLGAIGEQWCAQLAELSGADVDRAHVALARWFLRLRAENEGQGLSPRRALQTLGTEFGRETFGPDLWVNLAIREVKDLIRISGAPFGLITDGRFPNEAARVKAEGGCTVEIVDPHQAEHAFSSHASEQGVNGDELLVNDKTLGKDLFAAHLIGLIESLRSTQA